MLLAVCSGFLLALIAPWLNRTIGRRAGAAFALLPLAIFFYLLSFAVQAGGFHAQRFVYDWIPSLSISLSFYLDGLSLLFALLISGIGALVVFYSGGYLHGHHQLGRFYSYLLAFMASMLGVVLSDNLMSLFVFWELTSLTSFMLIGFNHEEEASRDAAWQALLVTGTGGLAMMAGFILLALAGGGQWEISQLVAQGGIQQHPWYLAILILVLAGAFTKSAQFPFHFWLPAAMAAPTPVSTYLHSATMVKAGVYLMARLSPLLGATPVWHVVVGTFGAATMIIAIWLAIQKTDLKQLLAYSTLSVLGTLTFMLGIGTETAVKAMVLYLLAHALYKATLFLVAGAIDHETGTRDVTKLGGLRKVLWPVALAGMAAAWSMSGLPPSMGFLGKELLYEATLHAPWQGVFLTILAVASSALMVTVAALTGLKAFTGQRGDLPKEPHPAPIDLWLSPLILATLGILLSLRVGPLLDGVVESAVHGVYGEPVHVHLALWHGFTILILLSVITVALGVGIYVMWPTVRTAAARIQKIFILTPTGGYYGSLKLLTRIADWQTRLLQSGYLSRYLAISALTLVMVVGTTLIAEGSIQAGFPGFEGARLYEFLVVLVMVGATLYILRTRSRLVAVIALGVVGFCVAVIFMLFGAPDLAFTQFAIETLSVILFVLVLYRMPRFAQYSAPPTRMVHAIIAASVGVLMTSLILIANQYQVPSQLTPYFLENSYTLARGRNIVNVILVDFRALDTMGEITVLGIGAIGVFALMKLRKEEFRHKR